MLAIPALLLLFGQPFWQTKPPEKWTDAQVESIRQYSPWTQNVGPSPELLVWLATAQPIEEAEAEARLRKKNPLNEPDPDFLDYLRDNRDQVFVLAIAYPILTGRVKVEQQKMLEEESRMLIGSRSYKILGHFPPTPSDPVMRLVFPRVVRPSDKNVVFQLFLPGLNFPERQALFKIKDLYYHGKLAM
jgi:hypothetical protein